MKQSMLRNITVLFRKSQSCLSVLLSKYNLAAAEQPFFTVLQKNDGVTQDELSSLVGVDKSATARTVKALEEKGYVTRVQNTQDKRENRVFLTAKARKLWPDVLRDLMRFNELLTQDIDTDTLDIMYASLKKIEENAIYLSKNKDIVLEQRGKENE